MQWSKYQLALFEARGNLVVNAVPGSGKTTSIEEYIKRIGGKTLAVTFTKVIADELAKRVPYASTLNSLGNSVLRAKFNKNKTLSVFKRVARTEEDYYKYRWDIQRVVSLMKGTLCENAADVCEEYGIVTDYEYCNDTFMMSRDWTNIIDFDDQLYFPYWQKIPLPRYDRVVVDEAQDLNAVQIELLQQYPERIYVGDTYQAIYGFRGSRSDTMSLLEGQRLPLSICYRCAVSIIQEANKCYDVIEPAPGAAQGICERVKGLDGLRAGDVVLCRTAAPLVELCLDLIREGKKAYVKGREVEAQLLRDCEIPDLDGWYAECCETLSPRQLEGIETRYEIMKIVRQSKEKVKSIFTESADAICLMTGHKSKGTEHDRVWIIRPDLIPHPRATDLVQEKNLMFVMITRAKKELYIVES